MEVLFVKKLFDCYSRLLIDNHISDVKDSYMRNFSPEEYVRLVKLSGVESSMLYACCHNGNCYYPTAVGHQHANLEGRDIFGETVNLLRRNNISPIAYYTATYHNDCAKRFPHAGIVNRAGENHRGRYWFTCPNQRDAVEFYKAQIREIVQYDIDGIFIDMTFWPAVCRCSACREKFGRPFPQVIDWSDPQWVAFQRFREKSLADFAAELTAAAKECKPQINVVHQFSPVLHGWFLGQSAGIAEVSDYASGDFYGGNLQQRFGVKTFDAFSRRIPFEFMTSRCVNLRDHTSLKCDEELFLSAVTTLANGGAYFFIDAINPDGSLNEDFYRKLKVINEKLEPFKKAVAENHFTLTAETGIYFSINCCVDKQLNGTLFSDFTGDDANNMLVRQNAVLDEALGTAEILNRMHIPFKIVKKGDCLGKYKALIINNCSYLDAAECEKIREFVASGGTLIATGDTSIMDFEGNSGGNFQLADVFGVDFSGKYSDKVTYSGTKLLLARNPVPLVTPHRDTEVRAYLTMPDFPAGDPVKYASIHSDPPGKMTGFPALTVNVYGKGKCVWLAQALFILRQHSQQEFGRQLFEEFLPQFLTGSSSLHPAAELTLLASEENGRHMLAVVNRQNDFPVVPLHNVKLEFCVPWEFSKIIRVSDGTPAVYERDGTGITMNINELQYAEFFIFE